MTVRDLFGTLDPNEHIALARENPCGLYPVVRGLNRFHPTEMPVAVYKRHCGDIVRKVKTLNIDGEPTTVIIII